MSPDAATHHDAHPALAHHFDSLAQQSDATTLGMWVFLVTEVLFFGGLFATYMIYRNWYPDAFAAGVAPFVPTKAASEPNSNTSTSGQSDTSNSRCGLRTSTYA